MKNLGATGEVLELIGLYILVGISMVYAHKHQYQESMEILLFIIALCQIQKRKSSK